MRAYDVFVRKDQRSLADPAGWTDVDCVGGRGSWFLGLLFGIWGLEYKDRRFPKLVEAACYISSSEYSLWVARSGFPFVLVQELVHAGPKN